jgi:hypothetical protein
VVAEKPGARQMLAARVHRVVRPDLEAVEEEWLERGVDRHDPLPAALRLAHAKQTPLEVDVMPVEPEERARRRPA